MYDIIGDIHGHADELVELLNRLGYTKQDHTYRHPTRTAVFVGDFIDRGPQIREVLSLVRPMCESEHALAVMGNHEFNALAYHTADLANRGSYLRKRSEKNMHQHAATLDQVPEKEFKGYLEWFRRLPIWLELNGLRVVHACWDAAQMSVIETAQNKHDGISTEFLCQATKHGTLLHQAIEDVLKGKEVSLPDGTCYRDVDGHERRAMRIKWFFSPANETFASYALTADEGLPSDSLPLSLIESATPYPLDADPVFFGHYWLQADRPSRLAANVACLDYSVATGGSLCAYRWDGERELHDEKFVEVDARE